MKASLSMVLALAVSAAVARAEGGAVKGSVSGSTGPAADAVVLIEGPSAPASAGASHAVMDQRQKAFVPHVLAVPVGTTIDFPNSDPVLHNVSSSSATKKFDLGMYGKGETRSVTFDAPGVVSIRCNVHPKMSAYVVVHTNPYLAVTDRRGGYAIENVPPGSYEVRVWHEDLTEKRAPVTVRAGQVQPLDIRLDRRR